MSFRGFTTRIIGGEKVYDEIAKLKHKPGKDIIGFGSRVLWNDLLAHGLVDRDLKAAINIQREGL